MIKKFSNNATKLKDPCKRFKSFVIRERESLKCHGALNVFIDDYFITLILTGKYV